MFLLPLLAAVAVSPVVSGRKSVHLGLHSGNSTASCAALASQAAKLIPEYESQIYASQLYPNGTTFTSPYASIAYNFPVPNLVEFCRFGAFFNTSSKSRVQFEVWMPTHTWNNRFAFVGNGGAAGGVNYPDMGIPLSKYGFAVASTDTGHNGSVGDGTFAINNPESQIDFGYRAVHLSTIFSKNVVNAFYGRASNASYWIGCSSGGKQGLKEVQAYPDDYDGVLYGSPAWWWPHLNGWTVQSNLLNPNDNSPAYINAADWLTIHSGILKQCDATDGVTDGLITDPTKCKVDFAKIEGITTGQSERALQIYKDWEGPNGTFLFPAFSPGSEWGGSNFILGSYGGVPTDYFKYQVLNYTSVEAAENVTFNTSYLIDLIRIGSETDPGQITADDFDISPFLNKGGKMIGYVGTADEVIPYGSSIYFYQQVVEAVGRDPQDGYRLFTVPGMGHCRGGSGAPTAFGLPGQRDVSIGGEGQSSTFDPRHDAILALIEWTEGGSAPDSIIATAYVNASKSLGIARQRPLCPYPKFPNYVGGDDSQASSFQCT